MRSERLPYPLPAAVAALCGVLAAAAAIGAGQLVAALLEPRSAPLLAVGNTAIDLTPEPVKQFAIRAFGESDKTALLAGMGLVLLVFAVIAGLVSRRDSRPGSVLVAAFGILGIAAVLARPDVGVLGVLAPVVATAAGVGVFRWLHDAAADAGAQRHASGGEARSARETEPDAESRSGGEAGPDRTTGSDAATRSYGETKSGAAPGSGAVPGSGSETGSDRETGPGRRRFLVSSVAVAAGAGVAGGLGSLTTGGRSSGSPAARRTVDRVLDGPPAQPVPAGADFRAAGTPSFITPNRDFYRIDTALSVPSVDLDSWRLRVHGMVERELDLGFADLARFPRVTRTITMTCVSNEVGGPYISTAEFTGVPIREVLLAAGVRPGAEQVFSTSADGFTAGTPTDALLEAERGALLAFGMNGEPLPAQHGYPVRMVTPGLYGYVSATKWLTDLELTTFAKPAYWIKRGWGQRAPIKLQSRIDRPGGFGKVPAGRNAVAGIAWAQTIGIDAVEVRVDGGPWQRAQLSTEVNDQTWRMWRADVDLAPGGHTVECRATDRNGRVQTPRRASVLPDGATGWHSVFCTAA